MPTPAIIEKTVTVPVEGWEDEEYCIMRVSEPDWSLCGRHLPDEPGVPDIEVPDEQTCPECLAILRAMKL